MTTIESPAIEPPRADWPVRLQIGGGTLLLWTVLVFGIDRYLLRLGSGDAVVLLGAPGGAVAGLAAAAVLFILALVLGRMVPLDDGSGGLLIFGLALAGWSLTGGTIDAWLIANHPQNGPATSGPYLGLLGDYLILAALVFGLVLANRYTGIPRDPDQAATAAPLAPPRENNGLGPVALLTNTVFAAGLVFLLAGPEGHTYHGQVLFGVAVAHWGAAYITRQLTGVRHALWYWPTPILVGLLATLLCAWQPSPGGSLENLNVLPAWNGLGRPLPIEMVGAGIASLVLTVRARSTREAA